MTGAGKTPKYERFEESVYKWAMELRAEKKIVKSQNDSRKISQGG